MFGSLGATFASFRGNLEKKTFLEVVMFHLMFIDLKFCILSNRKSEHVGARVEKLVDKGKIDLVCV